MWRERRPGTDAISKALGSEKGTAVEVLLGPRKSLSSVPKQNRCGELTAASAQRVCLVMAFTKGRGTLRYQEISLGLCYQLLSDSWKRTHLELIFCCNKSARAMFSFEKKRTCPLAVNLILVWDVVHRQFGTLTCELSPRPRLGVISARGLPASNKTHGVREYHYFR